MLPNFSPDQIRDIKNFVSKIQGVLLTINKAEIIADYQKILALDLSFFWDTMKTINVPHDRPANFDQLDHWEQILWIRKYGLPTAWKLINLIENQQ